MEVKWINEGEMEKELRTAGWIAAVSTDSDADHLKIANHCINSGHGTPTRSMRFLFEISGVSRVLTHEFVRHEIGLSKCQRSQRYVAEDNFEYVTPASLIEARFPVVIPVIVSVGIGEYVKIGEETTWLSFDDFQELSKQMYTGYVCLGAPKEDARYVLTGATASKIRVAFNWEGLCNFLYRRTCNRAQWEIRELAQEIRGLVLQNPLFKDFANLLGAPCEQFGYCPEKSGCGRAPSREEFFTYHC